ncbi:MAG: phosphate signaling complex protein PhoU [Planctomycetota bacterium]|jgi:phosphate transport system protein
MTKHFFNALEQLKRDLLAMGGLVETALTQATHAFLKADASSLQEIIDGDEAIDALELRIEEECLKVMALYGPTARDLRFVVAVFKITNDLERMGDLAVNIAERTRGVVEQGSGPVARDLAEMSDRARAMVRKALDAFVNLDAKSAQEVLAADDWVDERLKQEYEAQAKAVEDGQADFKGAVRVVSFAKHLERVADHATNIAEDVVYLASGAVVKHQH